MSVTEAARRLGVGRPALSSLLNGRAALSQDMALRLEATFGADRAKLLELQAESDRERRRVEDRSVAVGTYAPSFLTIEARRIEEWAGKIRARDRLPVLLRRLIHATGRELRHVDFPGYDNAQRHGWDGRVEAGAAAPWVPEGRSFWEFGVDQRPRAKAERDYRARLPALSTEERARCTFVFATPRNWPSKDEWARSKEETGDWKAVRALDASDLEQWLETTIAPRIWLAAELGMRTEGFDSLDHFWNRWTEASAPPLTRKIFEPSVVAHANRFMKWLKEEPGAGPLTVAADSRMEAVAFLDCLARHDDAPASFRDHAVVFHLAGTLRTLAGSPSPFIPIVYSEDTEREVATLYRERHCIVVRPRNAVDREPDVAVELLGHAAFEAALNDMGVERERVDRLAADSGRSPTVLRRRLSPVPAIRTPSWAEDGELARRLIPMALIGAWHTGSKADRQLLEVLAGRDYEEVERTIAGLLQDDDCPVWSVDQYRGVVSKIDAVFAVSPHMTAKDVTDFLDLAEYVLCESDPALELPEDRRWLAGVHGMLREHSSALRSGVCETLVMLSVHGNTLFRRRLGVDVAGLVTGLVNRILTPFTGQTLRSQDRDLPSYAEAAPSAFLDLLEEGLARSQPALFELLTPAVGVFEHPWRAGVLWALERLAWSPAHFARVVQILARLSQPRIDDNWFNKPINSLSGVLRSWLPQTAAPLDDRIKALEALCRQFPDVGWDLCIQQFEGGQQLGHFNARPRWRNDAAGAGYGVADGDGDAFRRKAIDLAISWPACDEKKLGDLVDRLSDLEPRDRSSVLDLIDDWSRVETDERKKDELRERVRGTVLTRRGLVHGLEGDPRDRAREVWERLASHDPVRRHAWLFANAWVEYSADELHDEDLDLEKRERDLDRHRREAMSEIWAARGGAGILELLADCHPWTVGEYIARAVDQSTAIDLLRMCLSTEGTSVERLDGFMQGFLSSVDEGTRSTIVSTLAETVAAENVVRLYKCAPFHERTWRLLDGQSQDVRERYWHDVTPATARFTESETTELVDGFLEVGRPREAFFAVHLDWGKVETSRLKRLLEAVVEHGTERTGDFRIEPWHVSAALDSLDGRPGVTKDAMAQLEFSYCDPLLSLRRTRHRGHGVPNLEHKLAETPDLFAELVVLAFKGEGRVDDPPQGNSQAPERSPKVVATVFLLLQQISRMPGTDDSGRVNDQALGRWVSETRRLCSERGRVAIGDQQIGQYLSKAPPESEDGPWPCRAVCEVLEANASRDIAAGFEMGVYNARGVHSRSLDEGGRQERELAAKYRGWAEQWVFEFPWVAKLLERIAKGYDRDAEREDSEVRVMKRLH